MLMIQFGLDTKPPGQVRKRSCSGFKYLFFGHHKRGWRRLETRGITNTTSRQQSVFVFTSVSFVFYLFLASSAVSFQLLLGSLGSSSSLHLHLTPSSDQFVFKPDLQFSFCRIVCSVSSVLMLFSTVLQLIYQQSPACVSTSSALIMTDGNCPNCPSKHYSVSSTQTQLDVSRLPVKDISLCRYKLSWKLSTGLVKKHLDLSQQTQLETSQLPVTKIYFYVPNILAGDVLILCQKYQVFLPLMELKIVLKTHSNVPGDVWRLHTH